MFKNEEGFTLVELAVSAAIVSTLSIMGLVYYTAAADQIKANIEQSNQQAADSNFMLGQDITY